MVRELKKEKKAPGLIFSPSGVEWSRIFSYSSPGKQVPLPWQRRMAGSGGVFIKESGDQLSVWPYKYFFI
jgi:hypothetical protein